MSVGLFQILAALAISITVIVLLTQFINLHAFFTLIIAAILFGLIVQKPFLEILTSMQSGFGSLLQQIGFLVAVGSCLGMMLEKTGAMVTISQRIIQWFGIRYSILAMTSIGVLVGIPVFCDSGFIILSRLIPSIASQASLNPAQLSLALSTGLYTTHTLVPPTPGPLAAAANLGASQHISSVILLGIITSIPVGFVSYLFAKKLGKNIPTQSAIVDLKSTPSISAWKAFTPLLLPLVLISTVTLPKVIPALSSIEGIMQIIGQPAIALMIGLLFSFFLINRNQVKEWPQWISEALKDAGVILLITGAGGAFGAVIKTSGIDLLLKEYVSSSSSHGVLFLCIGYMIAALLKTAQGSTTSAMIITSSLLAPLVSSAGFESPFQLATLIIAIGGGAMTVSHANDSFFWVVSQFGNISSRDAFRSFTLLTFIQGLTALLMSIILFLLL